MSCHLLLTLVVNKGFDSQLCFKSTVGAALLWRAESTKYTNDLAIIPQRHPNKEGQ